MSTDHVVENAHLQRLSHSPLTALRTPVDHPEGVMTLEADDGIVAA